MRSQKLETLYFSHCFGLISPWQCTTAACFQRFLVPFGGRSPFKLFPAGSPPQEDSRHFNSCFLAFSPSSSGVSIQFIFFWLLFSSFCFRFQNFRNTCAFQLSLFRCRFSGLVFQRLIFSTRFFRFRCLEIFGLD